MNECVFVCCNSYVEPSPLQNAASRDRVKTPSRTAADGSMPGEREGEKEMYRHEERVTEKACVSE